MQKKTQYFLLFPCTVLLVFFLVVPLLNSLFPTFFLQSRLSTEAYLQFFRDSYNLTILSRTIRIALLVTVLCCILGLPTAYFISTVSKKWKGILLALTLFPLLTNSVVRSFAWINILGKNGIVNRILLLSGLVKSPLTLLYTEFAIIIGSVYLFLPTMIMTLSGVMEGSRRDPGGRSDSKLPEGDSAAFRSRHDCRQYFGLYRNFDGLHDPAAFRRK